MLGLCDQYDHCMILRCLTFGQASQAAAPAVEQPKAELATLHRGKLIF